MKKVAIFLQILVFSFFLLGNTSPNIEILSQSNQVIEGLVHEKTQRRVLNGENSIIQTYDYLGADFSTGMYEIVVGDSYLNRSYALGTTIEHAYNADAEYDYFTVLGGINGDFFGGNIPIEAYIEDGGVVASGQGFNRDFIGFKDNGEVVVGTPSFDGYEIVIRDEIGKDKIKLPVKNINTSFINHPYDIYVFFDTYNQTLDEGVNKYILNTSQTIGALPKIFGKGDVTEVKTNQALKVEDNDIVIMSNNPYLENLIEKGDQVLIQRKLSGNFEGVRWGIGGWGVLVKDGEKNTNIISVDPNFRAPRSAIGIKQDGSVFFIAVDGRQPGYSDGINLYDFAELMLEYGAYQAINLDGGGSTTAVLKKDTTFEVINRPSGGAPRQVTNSIFIAKKNIEIDRTPYEIPDYSLTLGNIENIKIENGSLSFNALEGAENYEIIINGASIFTSQNVLNLSEFIDNKGRYTFQIRAIGDGFYYSDGPLSTTLDWDYNGPQELDPPEGITINNGILTWDSNVSGFNYIFEIQDKKYTLFQPRFNLNSIFLEPGIYEIKISRIGDDFNTIDSMIVIYTYRLYNDVEQEIKAFIAEIKDWFFYHKNQD